MAKKMTTTKAPAQVLIQLTDEQAISEFTAIYMVHGKMFAVEFLHTLPVKQQEKIIKVQHYLYASWKKVKEQVMGEI
jgi:hypothetical protein